MSPPDHIHIFTFKEGLLSRVAHDLRLHVGRFDLTRDGEELVARFEADSIVVDGVMKSGRFDPGGLGPRDKAKIVETIRTELLRVRANPTIEFRVAAPELGSARLELRGDLRLAGVTKPVVVRATQTGGRVRGTVELQPSRFGIAPYKALAGAIRLQDRVRVEFELDSSRVAALIAAPDSAG